MLLDARCPLLLASASPRRRELLARCGVPLLAATVAVDEEVRAGERPRQYLERIVQAKLEAALALALAPRCAAVLVADTVVLVDDPPGGEQILGKPRDDDDARGMLRRLAGRGHRVATRYAAAVTAGTLFAETAVTEVWFRALGEAQIDAYVATGEGRDKAGGYAIQGIGAMLVTRIEGCYSNVVGLPLGDVIAALQSHGLLGPCPVSARP